MNRNTKHSEMKYCKTNIKDVARSSRIPTGRLLDNMGASALVGDSLEPGTSRYKFLVS